MRAEVDTHATYTLSRTESTSHRMPYWKNLTADDMGRTVVEVAHHALNYPLGMAERIGPKAIARLTRGEPFKLGPFMFHAREEWQR